MKWRDFISDVYAMRHLAEGIESKAHFQPPALTQDLADLEAQLNVTLSSEFRSLLLEMNGVMSLLKIDDGDWFEDMWLLWPTHQIISENLIRRRESAEGICDGPFEDLLIFANAGSDGILFAHPIKDGAAVQAVVAWFPAEIELLPIAPTLKHFVEGWLNGQILL